LAIVANFVLLAACGGGDKPSLSSAYVKRANGLCGEWTKALKDLGNPPPQGDVAQTAVFTKRLVQTDTGYTDRFKALPATKAEQQVLGPIYAAFEAIDNAEAATLAAAEKNDRAGIQSFHQAGVNETAKMNVRLKALGLNVCA